MKRVIPVAVVLAASLGLAGAGHALTPQSREYYNQAIHAERRGELEQAEQALRKAIALDPADYLNHVKLGSVLNQQGKPNEAINYYQKALSLNPQDVMILYSLGSIYEQLGMYAQAEEAYALTLQNNPRYRFGLLNLARTEIQQQKYESAMGHYRQFLQHYPDHYQARRHLARLYLVTGKEPDAVREYEVLKNRFPDLFSDHVDLARALTSAKEPQKALDELKTAYVKEGSKAEINEEMGRAHAALGQADLAVVNYERAYALSPEKDDLLLRMAELYRERNLPDSAIAKYREFLVKQPGHAAVRRLLINTYFDNKRYGAALAEMGALLERTEDPQQRYDLQKDMAYAVQMQGDLDKAALLYEGLKNNPLSAQDWQLRSNLAIAYHKSGDLARAIPLYKQIYYADQTQLHQYRIDRASLGNDLAMALTALGDEGMREQNYHAALSSYGDATLYAPKTNYWPYLGMGHAYQALNMPEKALDAYAQVLARDPQHVTARLYHARLALAQAAQQGTPVQTHLDTLARLAKEQPTNVEVLSLVAEAQAQQGHAEAALALYEQALSVQPGQLDLMLAAGVQLQALKRFEAARDLYAQARSSHPNVPVVHYNLGIVYNELNDLDASAQAYQRALSLDPAYADAQFGLAITLEKQDAHAEALHMYERYLRQPQPRYAQEAQTRVELLKQLLAATPNGSDATPAESVAESAAPLDTPASVAPVQEAQAQSPVMAAPSDATTEQPTQAPGQDTSSSTPSASWPDKVEPPAREAVSADAPLQSDSAVSSPSGKTVEAPTAAVVPVVAPAMAPSALPVAEVQGVLEDDVRGEQPVQTRPAAAEMPSPSSTLPASAVIHLPPEVSGAAIPEESYQRPASGATPLPGGGGVNPPVLEREAPTDIEQVPVRIEPTGELQPPHFTSAITTPPSS